MLEQPTANNKPALDEESFTRLLAAAYVMQEHHDRLRAKVSPADLTEIIAQVVETQHVIQTRSYHGRAAFDLIVKRLCSTTGACGVALGILDAGKMIYRVAMGSAEAMSGLEIRKQDSLAAACLKTGAAFQSPLAQTDPRLNASQCRKVGAQSLLAVPLYHDGRVEGAIEVYFSQVSGFGDTEMRAAELMAGVASEVIADGAEQELREELETERASVLQALEVLEPELQKIADAATESTSPSTSSSPESALCRACGHAFVGNETFCGVCGASRVTGMYPGAALQSKWAVLWERHLTGAEHDGMPLFRKAPPPDPVLPAQVLPDEIAKDFDLRDKGWEEDIEGTETIEGPSVKHQPWFSSEPPHEDNLAITPWRSSATLQQPPVAAPARNREPAWLPILPQTLRQHWGDACLAAACIVLVATLLWAFWPRAENTSLANAKPPSMPAVKRRPRPKAPKLSMFEEALVGLGLAVPPPTPEYMGDPNIKVWEDLQTALYYCPDTDLYGNTVKGRYTTQAEAQQESFEPALRRPCD